MGIVSLFSAVEDASIGVHIEFLWSPFDVKAA